MPYYYLILGWGGGGSRRFYFFPMGWDAAEATGLGFVCLVVINPRVLSANRVDFGYLFTPLPRPTSLLIYFPYRES